MYSDVTYLCRGTLLHLAQILSLDLARQYFRTRLTRWAFTVARAQELRRRHPHPAEPRLPPAVRPGAHERRRVAFLLPQCAVRCLSLARLRPI
jgi:hypothetical protein